MRQKLNMRKIKITEELNGSLAESDVSTETELREILLNLLQEEPKIVILELTDHAIFDLGIGLPYGFVEFYRDWKGPYLMAVSNTFPEALTSDDVIVFNAGTPTPISRRFCLPYEQVVDIVTYFFQNGDLPNYVKWEEI